MCHRAAESAGRELICGASPYGAHRIREAVRCAQDWAWSLGIMPNGWSADDAQLSPLEEDELRGVLAELIQLKERDRWVNDTYPERLATLVLWIAHEVVRWPEKTRLGVAWAVLVLGMPDHHFELRKGREVAILRPSPLFFDTSVAALAEVMRSAYLDTKGHHRLWLFAQLDRRRREHEAAALQRRLNGLRSATPRDSSTSPPLGMATRPNRRFLQKLPSDADGK